MTKNFVVSTADIFAYDESENLLFRGITLLDSSITTKLAATDVRGGKGSSLQYVYYHSPDMSIVVNDCQWNLDFLANTVGSSINVGNNIYASENVVLTSGSGSVIGTPLAQPGDGAILYGWVTDSAGTVGTVVFTGKAFTYGSTSQTVCVRYYALNSASKQVTITSNFIPKVVKLIMSAQLASPDSASNIIGELQVVIPKASLSGNFTINLKADGVASTQVEMRALAYRDPSGTGGCSNADYYAKVTEIVTTALWYDNVVSLAILGGDRSIAHPNTLQLSVRAITSDGLVFTPPMSGLIFSSGTVGTATIGASTGLITTVAAGTTLIGVTITSKTSIDASFTLTVTS